MSSSRKREVQIEDSQGRKKKRKSRFDDSSNGSDAAAAAAKAAAAKLAVGLQPGSIETRALSTVEQVQLENARRAELIRKSIAAQMPNMRAVLEKSVGGKRSTSFMPAPLLFDDEGRQVDQMGKVIKETIAPVATLKANKSSQKAVANPYLSHREQSVTHQEQNVDPRIKLKNRETRGKKSFTFVKEGTYVKQAESLRNKHARRILSAYATGRNKVSKGEEGDPMDVSKENHNVPHDSMISGIEVPLLPEYVVPDIEWWDAEFLPKEMKVHIDKFGFIKPKSRKENPDLTISYDMLDWKNSSTWNLIEHPSKLKSVLAQKERPVVLPLMLTAKERKRIRRQNRAEREKERQDKVALGLLPPPEPKVKLSNMMRVMQEQAVADPSSIEKKVREQMAQREKNHEMRNQARKLTPEERREKKRLKLKQDAANQISVAIFRVSDMSHPQNRFKVDVNAQQLNITGVVIICKEEDVNLVVIEGGPKAIKKYIKLMTRRIDWNQRIETEETNEDDEEKSVEIKTTTKENTCDLVWQGVISRRSFNNFRFQECRTAMTARRVLEPKNIAHYWDMIYNYKPESF